MPDCHRNQQMAENLGYLPNRIVAGESIWVSASNTAQSGVDIEFDDYSPAAGYTLAYQFASDTPISVAATSNGAGDGWTLEVTGAQTLVWAAGRIAFAGIITHTATQRTFAVDSGFISVDASPMRVSSWKAVLTAVDAAIATYAANPNGSVSIEGMSISYRSLSQLTELRDYVSYRLQQDTASRPRRIIRSTFNTL